MEKNIATIPSKSLAEVKGLFKDEGLNSLVLTLQTLDDEFYSFKQNAEKALFAAFKTRWEYGKLIHDNYDRIINVCGSQRDFANTIGKSEAVISNNRRGFEYLKEKGCESWNDVVLLLREKNIKPLVSNFEKIGTLLNEPGKETTQKEQVSNDRLRLEQIRAEAEEILRRVEPLNKPTLVKDAFDVLEDIDNIKDYIADLNLENVEWESEKYLNHVRKFGVCSITGIPAEILDAHHTNPEGGSGPMGGKLADVFAIPVLRQTHSLIEEGKIKPTKEEILQAQFNCLASFIILNLK